MKKIFTLVAAAMLSLAGATAQNLFTADFKTADGFAAWTVVDANADGATWKFDDWGNPSYVYYQYSGANAGDDWLISPEIVPAKTGLVAVTYTFQGSSYSEAMSVHVGKTNTPADFGEALATYPDIKDVMHSGYVLVEAKEGEAFRVAFHATTPRDRFRLFLCSVEAKHIEAAQDLGVTAITSPVTGMDLKQENVTIKLKNYATSDVTNFGVAYQIDANEPVVETIEGTLKAGEEMEYTFKTKADLSTPRKLYNFKAYANIADDLNTGNDTARVSVRHQAPAAAPYFLGFEKEEDLSSISYYNLNNDDADWHIEEGGGWFSLSRTGNGCLAYNYNGDNAGNDWAILEPINVESGYYVLKFWYSATENHPERLSVHYGNGSTPETMTHKILEINPMTNDKYQEAIVILNFTEAQQVSFGFYSFSPKDENWILIDDLSFEKVDGEEVDLAVQNMTAPFDFLRPGNGTDVKFEVRNLGIKDVSAAVKLTIDGTEAQSQEVAVKGQEIKAVNFANALAALSAGTHCIAVEVTTEGDTNAENNTLGKDIVVLGTPDVFYNFEDATVPADFTFEVSDEGTVSPDAGAEFNEQGWGIIKVGEHPMLGTQVFAGTSWIDGVKKADRSVILPAVDVASETSYFVWDANSFNPGFLERYSVRVQDNTSSWPYFETKYAQPAEGISPTTRGISLAAYVGKNISIAFNITTANGDCLILDNLGIYGATATGIEKLPISEAAMVMTENGISVNGAKQIVLHDIHGRKVATVAGASMNLNGMTPGAYIATVKTAQGKTFTYKFVKK